MTREQRRLYATAVWDEVKRRRGTDLPDLPSSAEWDALAKLMDREVPLRVVLRGIEDAKVVKSLLYVLPAIETAINQWESRHSL